MTIVRQLNLLFIAAALLICCAVTLVAAQREYERSIDQLEEQASTLVSGNPRLQFELYNSEAKALADSLAELRGIHTVTAVQAFSTSGQRIVSLPPQSAPHLTLDGLRRDFGTIAPGIVSMDEYTQAVSTGFFPGLFGQRAPLYLTVPVVTGVNPTLKHLVLDDFAHAMLNKNGNASKVVIGYVALSIDRDELLAGTTAQAGRVFLAMALIFSAFLLVLQYFMGRITAPIEKLKDVAQSLAAGESVAELEIREQSEFADIARALNQFVKDTRNLNHEISMEKNLFRLKAEHTQSELTAKDEELHRVTDQVMQSREQIRKLASYDRITELPNRGLFLEHVNRLLRLAERDGSHTALLCMSLVNFDRIQESMGRNAGDIMLREVAKRLVGCLRASDMLGHYVDTNQSINVSRLSGDEFAVVLNRLASYDDAGDIAKRVIEAVSSSIALEGHEMFPNPAIGIAVSPRDGLKAEKLLKYASAAKQHAAASSTTNHLFFTEQMETGDSEEFRLAPAIREALAQNEFQIHYQPQINTTYGSITSAEALLRWEHPEYGQVSPFKFVPVAEESGLIVELGNWVLTEVCRQLREFREQGLELPRVALNISPQQMTQEFPLLVREALQKFELEPSSLELGLSEDILARDDGRALYILMELKSLGVHLSLENFGTTHSSFVYISRYPLDDIKIDRGFVADCDKREEATRLVDAIIAMANSLGLQAVAEGVETEGEYRYLINKGVRVMRGYLFSRPIPADELREQVDSPWHFMSHLQSM